LSRPANVRVTMPNVALPEFTGDQRFEIFLSERFANAGGHFANRAIRAAADVENLIDGGGRFIGEAASAGDIVNTDDIPYLVAVFEDHRRVSVEQAGSENREDGGVGIGEGLMNSVGVEESKSDGGNVVGAPRDQAKSLLIVFRKCIYRSGRGDFCFRSWDRFERIFVGIEKLPSSGAEL